LSPVDVLRKAKALIEEKGWHQGAYQGPTGCLCVRGACYAAAGLDLASPEFDSAAAMDAETAQYLLGEQVDVHLLGSLAAWNDRPGRTKEEVIAAFDKAIALAEQEASS